MSVHARPAITYLNISQGKAESSGALLGPQNRRLLDAGTGGPSGGILRPNFVLMVSSSLFCSGGRGTQFVEIATHKLLSVRSEQIGVWPGDGSLDTGRVGRMGQTFLMVKGTRRSPGHCPLCGRNRVLIRCRWAWEKLFYARTASYIFLSSR